MEHPLEISEQQNHQPPKGSERIDQLLHASLAAMNAISHPKRKLQPDSLQPGETFTAIGQSLWNTSRNIDQTRKLIDDPPEKGWAENELRQLPEWQTEKGNTILPALANFCRIGAMTNKDGRWIKTDFCKQIRPMLTSDWTETSTEVQAALKYSEEFREGMGETFDTAWDALQEPHIHHIVAELLPRKVSIDHDELLKLCEDDGGNEQCHHAVLRAVASLATLGAIEHHGHGWTMNVYGIWLTSSPDSPKSFPIQE